MHYPVIQYSVIQSSVHAKLPVPATLERDNIFSDCLTCHLFHSDDEKLFMLYSYRALIEHVYLQHQTCVTMYVHVENIDVTTFDVYSRQLKR